MDDLIAEFVAETNDNLTLLDQELVRFEQNPKDDDLLGSIFRVMHSIKGTCGFLNLPKLERVAHAGEDVLGRFRDHSLEPDVKAVGLILLCLDVIRGILKCLAVEGNEGSEDVEGVVSQLRQLSSSPATGSSSTAPQYTEKTERAERPVIDNRGFPVAAELLAEYEEVTQSKAPDHATPSSMMTDQLGVQPVTTSVEHRSRGPQAQTIRVNVEVIEDLMNLVSEMVLTRNQLLQVARSIDAEVLKEPLQRLSLNTSELQERVMKTRMQPVGTAWAKLPRIVRDLATELSKKIVLEMDGEETELDRQVLELIQDPLTHMVRNAVDHGIEKPEERLAAGKSDTGVIRLSAFHEGGHIVVVVSDDGRGLNSARIREKIVEKGLASSEEVGKLSDAEVNSFIMKAGFSTAAQITKVSGRGVGMDVVRSNIDKIGGTVEFQSEQGRGSRFTIKIPLTLAIVSALLVKVGKQRFAVPQIMVHELERISPRAELHVETLNGAPVLRLRDELLPLVNLNALLRLPANENAWRPGANSFDGYVVVCRVGEQSFGLMIDRIDGIEEIVVKPLSTLLSASRVFAGNTVLGDGSVILILDMNGIAAGVSKELPQAKRTADMRQASKAGEAILIFQSGAKTMKAVPLAQIHRIERVEMEKVELVQGRRVLQYGNGLLPLFDAEGAQGLRESGDQTILVFGSDAECVGIGIDRIVDVVTDELKTTTGSVQRGIVGSGIVDRRAVDIVDPSYFLEHARLQLSTQDGRRD